MVVLHWLCLPVGRPRNFPLLTVISACLLAEPALWKRIPRAACAVAVLLAIWLGGMALRTVEWTQPAGEPLSVALIQADIPQSRKWDPDHIQHTLSLYRDMSYAQGPVDLILWPETAVPVLQSQAQGFVDAMDANFARGRLRDR